MTQHWQLLHPFTSSPIWVSLHTHHYNIEEGVSGKEPTTHLGKFVSERLATRALVRCVHLGKQKQQQRCGGPEPVHLTWQQLVKLLEYM